MRSGQDGGGRAFPRGQVSECVLSQMVTEQGFQVRAPPRGAPRRPPCPPAAPQFLWGRGGGPQMFFNTGSRLRPWLCVAPPVSWASVAHVLP